MRVFMRLSFVVAATIAATLLVSTAVAQQAPPRLVLASDGSIWLLDNGVRQAVEVPPIDDDELAALPEGEPILDGSLPQPSPVVTTVVVVATPTARPVVAAPPPVVVPVPMATPQPVRVPLSGTGDALTTSFTLPTGDFRLQWSANVHEGPACYFGVSLKPMPRGASRSVATDWISETDGTVSGDVDVLAVAAGTYAFDVSADGCTWSLLLRQ